MFVLNKNKYFERDKSLSYIKQTISGLTAAIVAQQMLVLDGVNLYIGLFQIVLQGKNI